MEKGKWRGETEGEGSEERGGEESGDERKKGVWREEREGKGKKRKRRGVERMESEESGGRGDEEVRLVRTQSVYRGAQSFTYLVIGRPETGVVVRVTITDLSKVMVAQRSFVADTIPAQACAVT